MPENQANPVIATTKDISLFQNPCQGSKTPNWTINQQGIYSNIISRDILYAIIISTTKITIHPAL